MKELERKHAPDVAGGLDAAQIVPIGPYITPTYPVPEFPQNPITPIEPVTGTQKL